MAPHRAESGPRPTTPASPTHRRPRAATSTPCCAGRSTIDCPKSTSSGLARSRWSGKSREAARPLADLRRRPGLVVEPLEVLLHHSVRGVLLLGGGDAGLHHGGPARYVAPCRQYLALERGVEDFEIARIVAGMLVADCPAVHAMLAGFGPPTVQDAQVQDAVEGG